jgi:hypothetical protein
MDWLSDILDAISKQPAIGYLAGGSPAAEPTAIACLALSVHGRVEAAQQAAAALVAMQQDNGEVGVRRGETPGWPTSLAICAWRAVEPAAPNDSLRKPIERATNWLVANRGRPVKQTENFGHNTELVGWAVAEGTHSWVEPTAFAVLALKSVGRGESAEAREGVAVLIDRQLPGGGLNYGNTVVLGQLLRSHIEPTAIGLLALAGAHDANGRLGRSIDWLRQNIGAQTPPQSLAWAVLALRGHGVDVSAAIDWLGAAATKLLAEGQAGDGTPSMPATLGPAPFKMALLGLAAKGWPV